MGLYTNGAEQKAFNNGAEMAGYNNGAQVFGGGEDDCEEGVNRVVNGIFTTDLSGWQDISAGGNFAPTWESNNSGRCSLQAGVNLDTDAAIISQDGVIKAGYSYQVKYTAELFSNSCQHRIGGVTGSTASGSSFDGVINATTDEFNFRCNVAGATCKLNNVEVYCLGPIP